MGQDDGDDPRFQLPVPLRDARSGVTVEVMRWTCGGCGKSERAAARDIWLHAARCQGLGEAMRQDCRELLWQNWDADEVSHARFRRLVISITICCGRHGCWWCHDLRWPGRHPVQGPWLAVAAGLAGFKLGKISGAVYDDYQAEAQVVRDHFGTVELSP